MQRFAGGATRVPPPLPENYLSLEAHSQLDANVADIARSGVLTMESLTLATLAPEAAFWAQSSRRLMGAFLAAALRRKSFRCEAQADETSFASP